jgi:hypothetical protein
MIGSTDEIICVTATDVNYTPIALQLSSFVAPTDLGSTSQVASEEA